MSVFTQAEIEYLQSQRLGRLATVGSDGQPHVVPCRYRYSPDADTLDIGGAGFATSKKFRDAASTGRVAFVVDDLPGQGRVRGIEVRGQAEVQHEGGEAILPGFDPTFIRLRPAHIASWGINSDDRRAESRDIGLAREEGPGAPAL